MKAGPETEMLFLLLGTDRISLAPKSGSAIATVLQQNG